MLQRVLFIQITAFRRTGCNRTDQIAVIVDDRYIEAGQSSDGGCDEALDPSDLIGTKGVFSDGLDGDGSLGALLDSAEQGPFGKRQMDPGEADAVHHHDGPGKFALQCALVIHLLREFGQPHIALVEQFEPDHSAHGDAGACDHHTRLVRLVFGHQHAAPLIAQTIGNPLFFQLTNDGGGVRFANVLVQHAIAGLHEGEVDGRQRGHHGGENGAEDKELPAFHGFVLRFCPRRAVTAACS